MRYAALRKGQATLQGPTQIEPELAQSWKRTSNGSHIFTLRAARSPYGNTVSTADVVWSFNRMLAIDPIAKFLMGVADIDPKHPIKAMNGRTFELRLTQPNSLVLAVLTNVFLGILDSKEARKHATSKDPWAKTWLGTHTATFGPYQLATFTPAQRAVLTATLTIGAPASRTSRPRSFRPRPARERVFCSSSPVRSTSSRRSTRLSGSSWNFGGGPHGLMVTR